MQDTDIQSTDMQDTDMQSTDMQNTDMQNIDMQNIDMQNTLTEKISDPMERYLPYLKEVREQKPLVHCITNVVTIWDCANLLLAAGASPTMAHHPQEVAEITAGCKALVCNLGATESFDAMLAAAPVAASLGHPVVVDPVGCGGSSFRRGLFRQLTEAAQITCLRGNASEIRALALDRQTVTGVDADPSEGGAAFTDGFLQLKSLAKSLASRLHCIVIASGPVDIVTDGEKLFEVGAGDPQMSRITGTGCMSSAMLGAFLAADNSIESALACCQIMGYCGEQAAEQTREEKKGNMTFHMHFIDEMSMLGALPSFGRNPGE